MTDSTEPRLATEREFPEIVDLLDRVFNYGSGGMPAHIPNWFDESHPERYAVIERDGRVVSTVGCVPQTFVVGSDEIEWWGLGNVATDKHYRGNGHMSALLEFWLDRMREAGVPLTELGGDRKRYNRYGWENAGRELTYTVTERTFPGGSPEGTVRRYEGSDADLDLLGDVHGAEPLRVKRTREGYDALFDQHGVQTLLYTREGDESYLSFNQEAPSGRYSTRQHTHLVPEFGGTEDGLRALFAYLWRHHAIDRIGVPVHPTHHLAPFLHESSTSWSMGSHRMVNVLDLEGALEGVAGQLSDRWAASHHPGSGAITLSITDSDDPPVTVHYDDDAEVSVERTPGRDPDVALDRLSMTTLLFGFPETLPSIRREEPFLDAVLPVDFYIWKLEGP